MSSIDPTSRLLAQLRQSAEEWRRERVDAGAPPTTRAAPAAKTRKARQQDDAFAVAVREAAEIDPDDPQARHKAFRIYLAAVLTREFGPRAAHDPGFSRLVDRVRDTMRADAQLNEAIEQAGEFLLKAAHKR